MFLKNVNLVETPFEIKISDFRFAKAKNLPGENREHSICGTPAYMAPDQVVGKDTHYTEKFDIWALGAIYYELLVGIPPFIERTIEKFKHKLYEGSYEFPENVTLSPEGVHFISRCL